MKRTPRRRPNFGAPLRVLVVGLMVSALATSAGIMGISPVYATNYPSWDDVVAARSSEAAKQTEIGQLESLISGLQTEVASTQAAADQAWSANQAAQDALTVGTQKADQLKLQVADAQAKADLSRKQAAARTAQFAKSAGSDLSMQLLVSGDQSSNLLYQLGAVSKLSETSKKVFTAATQDANTAASLSDQATVAQNALSALADAAKASLDQAVAAQQQVKAALLDQEDHQAEMTVQLAALQTTAVTTEADYNAGVAAEKQRQLEAEQAAAAAQAAADAAAAAAAQNAGNAGGSGDSGNSGGSSGGSSDSGSSGGSSGGGSSAPITDAPTQAFNGAAVVAYAEQYVGVVPYGWGANPDDSFGCDGLTQWVYGHFGIRLPRLVSAQTAMGVRVSSSEVRAGDLVVWPNTHIGIYDGNGGVIHSPDWGRYVTHNPGLWGSYIFIRIV